MYSFQHTGFYTVNVFVIVPNVQHSMAFTTMNREAAFEHTHDMYEPLVDRIESMNKHEYLLTLDLTTLP